MRLDLEEETRARGGEAGEHVVEPLPRVAGPARDAEPRELEHRRPAPSSAGSRRTRRRRSGRPGRPSAARGACRRCARGGRARRPGRGTRPARARARVSAGACTVLWPGSATTTTTSRSKRELPVGGVGERDVAHVRRVERAAEQARSLRYTERLVPDLDLAALPRAGGAERGLELVGRRRRRRARGSRGPCGGSGTADGAWLRPVDEEVGEACGICMAAAPRGGQSSNSVRRNSSTPSPVAHESAKTPHDPLVVDAEARRLGQRGRPCSGRRPAGSSSSPAPYCGRARGRSRGTARPDRPRRRRSRGRATRARSRCARNSWPSPTPRLAPSIRPGTSATVELTPVGRVDGAEHGLRAS